MERADPGPEEKKRTNEDEQDIAVNQSTQDHGYDEPVEEKKVESEEPVTESVKTSKEAFEQ